MPAEKRKLLVLSHVLPFPPSTGQCQRVRYTCLALRKWFHVTFATSAPAGRVAAIRRELSEFCDEAVVWQSRVDGSVLRRARAKAAALAYAAATGLKASNYYIGKLEFSPEVLQAQGLDDGFDVILLEYWHASESMRLFRSKNIRCVVDLHNILWQAREKELDDQRVPEFIARNIVQRYKQREETSWQLFDALITINRAEHEYIRSIGAAGMELFYAPMGIPMERWPYCWLPDSPPALMYYGGLGSSHNRRDALRCFHQVMPLVWARRPDVNFWIVGSNPNDEIRALERDRRVKVTGFVERPQDVLGRATAVLCPWSGTYGFRSRLVEVMALGTPVIASKDAAYGMELEEGAGFHSCSTDREMADHALALADDPQYAASQSHLARQQIEERYSFENSYGRLAMELHEWVKRTGSRSSYRAAMSGVR